MAADGTDLWASWLDGSDRQEGRGLAVDSLSNVYITGFSNNEFSASYYRLYR